MQSVIWNILYLSFLNDISDVSSTVESSANETSLEDVCYNVYDSEVCFSLDSPWANESRPLPQAPMSPDVIKTVFYMYSRSNASFPTVLKPESLYSVINTPINRNKTIFIITHGYLSSSQAVWMKGIIGELLRADEENVIVVDWGKGARPPYIQAMANLRVVSMQIAKFIYSLTKFADIPPSSFHLIGHSLGAHLLGQCGGHLREIYGIVLRRITGLDPAGPLFVETHPLTRLDSTDAQLVDVIHTDDAFILGFPISFGLPEAIGDVDFYPNGGGGQPQCEGDLICQHFRASKLFIESIRQSCTFIGIACDSFEEFVKGECWGCQNDTCSPMGMKTKEIHNQKPNSKFFLLTNGDSPYCGSHYRVTIKSSNDSNAWSNGGEFALISINMKGARESTGDIQLSEKSVFYKTGSVHRQVILAHNVGDLASLDFLFEYPRSLFNPMSWRIRNPTLHLLSITIEQLVPEKSWTFCFPESHLTHDVTYKLTGEHLC